MTNAEAIETLRANYPDACFEKLREAVDVAIEALKVQDEVGDTISRQAAIDAVGNMLRRKFGIGGDLADITLTGLPSAEPKWIPVAERLPEKHEWVLVRSKLVKMKTDFISNDGRWYATPGITHWMPLPEPPKEE